MACCDSVMAEGRKRAAAMRADPLKFSAFIASLEKEKSRHLVAAQRIQSLLDFSEAMEKQKT